MKIFLIGFMGSGKTYTGERLAKLLHVPFIDLDEQIVDKAGMSIPEIFAQQGEPGFRKIEREVLHDLASVPTAVVSTGGGVPCFFDNLSWMKQHGLTIYLQTEVRVLVQRLCDEMEQRPLLRHLTPPALEQFITDKLTERTPFYQRADVIYHQKTGQERVAEDLAQHLQDITGH